MRKIKEVDFYGNVIMPGPSKLNRPRDEHPYGNFFGTKIWKAIDKAIEDLVKNQDIEELTHRSYIVGYLCKKLSKANRLQILVKVEGKDEFEDMQGNIWKKST
jgi:hypothetical protein